MASYKLESGSDEDMFEEVDETLALHDGIGIDLDNGSLTIECAQWEWHATTALTNPDQKNPSRVSIVMYQHQYMDLPDHGRKDV